MNERLKQAARLYAARDYPGAEAICRAIIAEDQGHFDALHLLGVLATRQERPEEALPYLRRAQAARPDHPLLRVNLGNALLAVKHYDAAVAVSLGGDGSALNNLGLAYRGLEQHEAAEHAFRAATQARWDNAPAWFNLATTLVKLDRLNDALQAARTALRVAPLDTPVSRLAEVTNEMGRILMALGRPEDALAACARFVKRHPDQTSVMWNMSLCLLLLGRFEEGWAAYEHRFDMPDHDPRPEGSIVLDPAKVAGQRVLVLSEQGRGDMLQFIRYAPLLAERGARVRVQAYPDLVDLLATAPGVEMVVSTEDPRPEADLVTPVMSLPLAFGTQPAKVPYLHAPPGRSVCLGPRTRPRIGVAWSGSTHSYERSAMAARTLAPLLALQAFTFHCLQKEITDGDRAWLNEVRPPIVLHTEALSDFADTAALIAQMDAVVTVDTAVAHLAGALGKPVYVMLSFNPDWRWLLGRGDSLWYPTACLFRQRARGAWDEVVQAVIAALTR